jgi:hypothetical protein
VFIGPRAASPALPDKRFIDNDADEPGRKPYFTGEFSAVAIGRDEGVLYHVLCTGIVLHDAARGTIQQAAEAAHERAQALEVPRSDPARKLDVCRCWQGFCCNYDPGHGDLSLASERGLQHVAIPALTPPRHPALTGWLRNG